MKFLTRNPAALAAGMERPACGSLDHGGGLG